MRITIKSNQWGKGKPGEEWAGDYEIRELNMTEEAEISQEILNDARVRGVSPLANTKQYDILRLKKVVVFPRSAPKDLSQMPGKLYRLLQRIDQQLNGVSDEELNFLLK